MNWDALSAISEIVSGVAVFISLLYLAFQVRFARLAAADTSRTARSIGVRENVLAMANSSELCKNWMKSSGLNSKYEMLGAEMDISADGAIQVDNMCQCWMWLHWGQYKSIKTEADLEELENIVSAFYSVPPMLNCWRNSPYGREIFDEKFVQFVEDAISKKKHGG